jgi:RNA polymerase sigma factor (sigma-70 family)
VTRATVHPPRRTPAQAGDAAGGAGSSGARRGGERGVPEGVAAWAGRYGAELRRHLVRMLRSEDDAEDALQQVWIAALRTPPDADAGSNVRAWLYRVATNAALDRIAADRRRRTALDGRGDWAAPEGALAPDAFVARVSERGRARIREQVARLPRKQREAVWWRWVEGLDYATIAARLACSEESARANVYQGMKRLRRELADLWREELGG